MIQVQGNKKHRGFLEWLGQKQGTQGHSFTPSFRGPEIPIFLCREWKFDSRRLC